MGECQRRIQRAPSAICLLCASCRRRVTPCIVCAHLLPCCFCCNQWPACRRCNVKNPMGDEERRLLGFPPASALPTSMVRRVLIAYIGRPSCTMATHLLYQRLHSALSEMQEATGVVIGGVTNDKDSFDLLNLSQIGLPFIQCEGIVTNAALTLQKQISDSKEGNHLLLEGDNNAGDSCSDCSGNCKLACLNEVMVDNIDAALRRCQEQLVALHCAEAFSADSKCSAYPLCNTIIRSSLTIGEMKTCNTKMGCNCSLGLGRGFSTGMLRMVNSGFVEDFETWLAKNGASSQESCKFEDILVTVEAFIEKHDQILDLQRSMLKAGAAQKQVVIDSKADMPTQSLFSTVCMLEQFFADRIKERMEKLTRVAKPFLSLLRQINLVLEFLYTRICGAALLPHSFPLCTNAESVSGCTDMFSRNRHLQTAVSYWLLLYHDVAHATGVI